MKLVAILLALTLSACGGGGDYVPPTEFSSTMACFKNPGVLEVGKRYYLEDCSKGMTPLDHIDYKFHYRDTDGVVRSTFFGGPTVTFVVFNAEQRIEIEYCVRRQLSPVPIPRWPAGGFFDQYVNIDCVKAYRDADGNLVQTFE